MKYRDQLRLALDIYDDSDEENRCRARKEWAMGIYRRNRWCGPLDPTRREVAQMVRRILDLDSRPNHID